MTPQEQLDILIVRLENLTKQHQSTSVEITRLREDISKLQKSLGYTPKPNISRPLIIDEVPSAKVKEDEVPEINIDFSKQRATPPPLPKVAKRIQPAPQKKKDKPFNLEEFIGGNLINKIGILILIIGLGLFVKYAIDNGYFPPLVRLILSFLAGLTLAGLGYRFKPKYKTYSAVLFSGGMAVLYFSAYGGNAFYDPILLPRMTAFILMVVFTIVTVLAAWMYNLEIIALLGLVGAYGVPFLLGDDSGNFKLLLSYIAIINTGVLLVCIRKNWRLTLYSAFLLTWLIIAFWVFVEYTAPTDTSTAWFFSIIYFALFYIALIAHNLIKQLKFAFDNVLFITLNAFFFYGLGMTLLDDGGGNEYQGLFTICNGVLHLGVSLLLYRKLADKKLFTAISGLFWVFLTITIGVQFESETRSILWMSEAALLFGIGRRYKIDLYEIASYLVLGIGLVYLLENWMNGYYNTRVHLSTIANRYFLNSVLALMILGAMLWMSKKWKSESILNDLTKRLLPALVIGVLYFAFFNEIYHQYEAAYLNSEVDNNLNWDILQFRTVWLLNYSLIFIVALFLFNNYYLKNKLFTGATSFLAFAVTLLFLLLGLPALNELRSEYLNPDFNPLFVENSWWIWIRYVSYLFLAAVVYGIYKSLQANEHLKNLNDFFRLFVYMLILIILSNELTTFMTMVVGVDTSSLTHRVGYSILWALFAAMMIWIGFRQRSKLLRVSGIVLFAITLLKIFFLDLADISTESRILLFVAIGVLLLVVSYFYQRFSGVLLGEED